MSSGQSSPDLEVAALFNAAGEPTDCKISDEASSKICVKLDEIFSADESCNQDVRLHIAAGSGDIDAIKKLLSEGADINAIDNSSNTPLVWASNQRKFLAIDYLVSLGANLDSVDGRSNPPLTIAANIGYSDVCTRLLKYGANIDATNTDGATPLMFAAFNGHDYIVQLLLDHGADLTVKDNSQRTAMEIAYKQGKKKVMAVIEKYLTEVLMS